MQTEPNLLLISLIAGALTVISPCIMSLLPIIVGGSIDSDINKKDKNTFNYKKAFIVISSLAISVLFFTFTLKVSSIFINVPELFWKIISGGIIIFVGLFYIFPKLWSNKYLAKLNLSSNIILGAGESKKNFLGYVLVGAALGPIFATCSPTYFIILATILPVSLFAGSIYMFAFTVGMSLFLFILSLLSSKILNKLEILTGDGSYFRKALGLIFLVIGVLIITGADKKLELRALENGYFDITKIERYLLNKKQKESDVLKIETNTKTLQKIETEILKLETEKKDIQNIISIEKKIVPTIQKQEVIRSNLPIAPEFVNPSDYINTNNEPITLGDLKNKKVTLVSIWTFSCINCKRTLPYLNSWYDKYKGEGLEIVGVHAPEFSFEKVKENVENAVIAQGIKYPVLLDNDYETWNAYNNNYWPHRYLIDENGYIIYEHIGEGDYDETELQIQKALKQLKENN